MTKNDVANIVDAVINTRDVKPITKMRVLQELIPVFTASVPGFTAKLYWEYQLARFRMVLNYDIATQETLPSTKP